MQPKEQAYYTIPDLHPPQTTAKNNTIASQHSYGGSMPKRHYPPAKRRYEQRHPTVSFRCQDREEYEFISEMAKRHGMSKAQYVKQALYKGIKECDRAYWKGYRQGFLSGVKQAYQRFAFFYICSRCGELIIAPRSSEPYIEASAYLTKTRGWHHKDCNNPIQRFRIADEHATVLLTHYANEFTVEPLNE